MTTGNQTTRCINAIGMRVTDAPNHVMAELFNDDFCKKQREISNNFRATHFNMAFVDWS